MDGDVVDEDAGEVAVVFVVAETEEGDAVGLDFEEGELGVGHGVGGLVDEWARRGYKGS